MLFILLILVSVMSAIFSLVLIDEEKIWYLPPSKGGISGIIIDTINDAMYRFFIYLYLQFNHYFTISGVKGKILKFFQSALTFLILYNNLIPISLTVTLEVVRFIQVSIYLPCFTYIVHIPMLLINIGYLVAGNVH